jgi:hypothetical protein
MPYLVSLIQSTILFLSLQACFETHSDPQLVSDIKAGYLEDPWCVALLAHLKANSWIQNSVLNTVMALSLWVHVLSSLNSEVSTKTFSGLPMTISDILVATNLMVLYMTPFTGLICNTTCSKPTSSPIQSVNKRSPVPQKFLDCCILYQSLMVDSSQLPLISLVPYLKLVTLIPSLP